jgi:hypothetical protein
MISGTGTVAGTAGTVGTAVTAGTASTVGTAGTSVTAVTVLAEVAVSSDSVGGGAIFLKVDYSQCLIFKKTCDEMDFTRTFQASPKCKSRSNI